MRGTGRVRSAVAVAVVAVLGLAGCQHLFEPRRLDPLPPVQDGSELVGCDRAGERVRITASSHLDPACTYAGIDVEASDVVLDCRGATVAGSGGGVGVAVRAPVDADLHDITVRNCTTRGFTNGMRVTREGFRSLPPGGEYEHGFTDVVLEHNNVYEARGSGIFVDGYVTGVTIRDTHLLDNGGVGIYLEAGSMGTEVAHNVIVRNGYGEVDPEGIPFVVDGVELRYLSTGREGIAVDGSRENHIHHNVVLANSNGGVMLYENCGEYVNERPATWWERRYGADRNLIEHNLIGYGPHGVWIGSRMAESTEFMDCSDEPYVDQPFRSVRLDHAASNTVRSNTIAHVRHGIRVEDDHNRIEDNTVIATAAGSRGIIVGTKERTGVLGLPVTGTVVAGNRVDLPEGSAGYEWIWAHEGTTVTGNLLRGAPVADLVEGVQPPIDPHVMVARIWLP